MAGGREGHETVDTGGTVILSVSQCLVDDNKNDYRYA